MVHDNRQPPPRDHNGKEPQEITGWSKKWERPRGSTAIMPHDPAIEESTGRQVTRFEKFGRGPKNLFQFDFGDGEYHRVLSKGTRKHGALIDPRSNRERVATQLIGRVNRKKARRSAAWALIKSLPGALIAAALVAVALLYIGPENLKKIWPSLTHVDLLIFMKWLIAFVGIVIVIKLFKAIIAPFIALIDLILPEAVYQMGFQWSIIDGPKVYDPPAETENRRKAATQANPMGEQEQTPFDDRPPSPAPRARIRDVLNNIFGNEITTAATRAARPEKDNHPI